MSTTDPLAPMARLARRVPGYPAVRRVLLPRVRQNTIFRAIAHKLWVTEVTPDGRGADLTAGTLLAGEGLQNLPVVLFVLVDVPEPQLEEVVDEIAGLQLLTAGFRVVLVLPTADFGCARKYGYPAELMPDSTDPDERIRYWQRLRHAYGTTNLYEIGPGGLSFVQRTFLMALADY